MIVDFWAPWCGPCKTLTPAIEKAVTEARGKVRLVKIDVDQNQMIASQMRVQSIPAVFAFVDGQPVDGFMGAQSASQIKAFVDRVIAMAGPDAGLEEAIAAAEEMLAEGAVADAAQTFAAILAEDEGNRRRCRPGARASRRSATSSRRTGILALAPPDKENDPGDRRRARADRARRGERRRGRGRRAARRRWRRTRRPSGPLRSRAGADRQGRPRGVRSTRCSSCSAATASGTRGRRRRSSSSSSTASARRASRRRRAVASCPR